MTQLSGTQIVRKRLATRYDCNIVAQVETKFGAISCQVQNISSTGLMASTTSVAQLVVGQVVNISQAELGKLKGIVMWTSIGKFGISFSHPISDGKLSNISK